MKTILIPTDFTIESLNTVKGAFKKINDGEQVNLILVYSAYLSDSITDRLFYSKEKHLMALQGGKFREACHVLLNTYASRVHSFRTDLFSGYTKSAFTIFLEANEVDEVVIPGSYNLKMTSPRSFDPISYFKKCSLPITTIQWQETYRVPEKDRVAELFLMTNHV